MSAFWAFAALFGLIIVGSFGVWLGRRMAKIYIASREDEVDDWWFDED